MCSTAMSPTDSQQSDSTTVVSKLSTPSTMSKPRLERTASSWFAEDPSKAYYEKFSLIWAPLSMAALLVGVFGTPLHKYCDRRSFLLLTVLGCLPGVIIPILFPCKADRGRPYAERFWVKASVWIAIFGFYGNYFWTHYFYQLLGAEYLFDSYRFNDVPLVTYTATFFYFTFYFSFVNVVLRRANALVKRLPQLLGTMFWWSVIFIMAYGTAVFEAVSIQHFPLYTYTERNAFLTIGSIVYGLYFIVGFPMFFWLDESYVIGLRGVIQRKSLKETAINAFAATAIVTLLLDLWRLLLGSIYEFERDTAIPIPFLYQGTQPEQPRIVEPTVTIVEQEINLARCAELAKSAAKGWADEQVDRVKKASEIISSNGLADGLQKGENLVNKGAKKISNMFSFGQARETWSTDSVGRALQRMSWSLRNFRR